MGGAVGGWHQSVDGVGQWVAPMGYGRDGLVGERSNGLGCDL